MNPRFDLATIKGCSEIPACRGREVLSLLIDVDPISGKESQQYPDAYPKKYRERVENFSRNYSWRKITGDITIEFLEAAVERMFTADEVSSVVDLAKLKELKHRIVQLLCKMTLDEITGIDKELIGARDEAAIKAKFGYAVKLLDVLSAL